MEFDRNDLTTGSIWKKLLGFLFPVMLGMLFQQLYNTVDAIIVGKYVGKEALAAVGGSPAVILNLIIGFFTGLGTGATVIVAQYFGAKDHDNLSRTVQTSIAFSLLIGVVLSVVGYYIAPWTLEVVDTPADVMQISTEYLRIFFVGTIPILIFNIGSGILRAVGDSRRPLYFLVVCCVINIALDLLFVAVLNMGVVGAGWASVISLTISAVLVMITLCNSPSSYRLHLRQMRIEWPTLKKILHIGIPAGMQSALYSLSNLVIQIGINRLGTTVVAAWTAIGKFDGIYWVIINAVGLTICAFAGQCFGAGKYERMKQGVRKSFIFAEAVSIGLGALVLLLADVGMHIIIDDPEVIAYSIEMLWYFVPFYGVWAIIEVLSGTVRGAGDSVRPMFIVTGVCLIRVVWMMFIVPNWNTVMGISMSYPVSWVITAIVMVVYYFKSDWLNRCIAMLGPKEQTE